jgi:hypothetical protein
MLLSEMALPKRNIPAESQLLNKQLRAGKVSPLHFDLFSAPGTPMRDRWVENRLKGF